MPKINLLRAKTILTKSGLPGADWVIKPYNGCLFGCLYRPNLRAIKKE
ncbi:MAG: hypothetical protein ABIB61_04835 [Candidatus Shapirobacteria bacterium]